MKANAEQQQLPTGGVGGGEGEGEQEGRPECQLRISNERRGRKDQNKPEVSDWAHT